MKLIRSDEFNKDISLKAICDSYDNKKLERYLKWKGYGHDVYTSYSTIERWNKNLNREKGLFLSNGVGWNDMVDREEFLLTNEEFVNFAMCFSSMKSENVAMWMLYGGKGKQGGMISLNEALIHRVINECTEISYGYFEGDEFVGTTIDMNKCVPELIDVLYYGRNSDGTVTLSRGNEEVVVKNDNPCSNIRKYKKAFPWKYECECRLVVKVDKGVIKEEIEKKPYFLKIGLSDQVIKEIKNHIYYAPNYNSEMLEGYRLSELKEKIDWNLCRGCNFEYFKEQRQLKNNYACVFNNMRDKNGNYKM